MQGLAKHAVPANLCSRGRIHWCGGSFAVLQGGDAHSAENQEQFSQIQFAGTNLARSKSEAQSTKKKNITL